MSVWVDFDVLTAVLTTEDTARNQSYREPGKLETTFNFYYTSLTFENIVFLFVCLSNLGFRQYTDFKCWLLTQLCCHATKVIERLSRLGIPWSEILEYC